MPKGYVEYVLGSGFSHDAVRKRTRHPTLTGKRLLSFTTSESTEPWPQEHEQETWISLRNLFDMYLARAFSMRDPEHVHFGSIVEGMKARFTNKHLDKVETEARRICADVAVSARQGRYHPSTGAGGAARATGMMPLSNR